MMWTMRVENVDRGTTVGDRIRRAHSMSERMVGLLRTPSLEPGDGLWIEHAASIHMFFMRFPIDAVFLDRELRVLRVATDLKPWRLASKRGAKAVLELPAGRCERAGVSEGDQLALET
jgi:hypothetical protein